MVAGGMVGSMVEIWRFPVKSMQGESLEQVELEERGVLGDRAYALIDEETGKVVSAKSVTRFPNLLECRATFVEPPQAGSEMPPVLITLPDGASVTRSRAGRARSMACCPRTSAEMSPWRGLNRRTSPSISIILTSRAPTQQGTEMQSSSTRPVQHSSQSWDYRPPCLSVRCSTRSRCQS